MDRKIKILFGLESAEGGALKHLFYLVSNLHPAKFEVTVILSDKRSGYVHREIGELKKRGVRVLVVPMRRSIHLYYDAVAFIKIFGHLVRHDYDIVHAHSSKAGALFRLAGWLRGIGCIIYTPHCFYFQGKTGPGRWLFIWIERLLGMITDHVIVSNSEKEEALRSEVVQSMKLVDINNSIRVRDMMAVTESDTRRAELGIGEHSVIIGAVGRLTRQKDWPTYILAARETVRVLDNVVFLIVGEGEDLESITRLIESLHLQGKVIATGFREDIGEVFRLIDIYISTSLWEGLPYVLVEAMSYRKPVIATDLNYGKIIIDSKSGYLVEKRDYKVIASRIIELVRDRKLRNKMGRFGRRLARRHLSFSKFICKHEKLYESKFTFRL